MFKFIQMAFDKIKTNKTPIEEEETLGMKSVVALFVEAASIDGIVAESEKKYILKIILVHYQVIYHILLQKMF